MQAPLNAVMNVIGREIEEGFTVKKLLTYFGADHPIGTIAEQSTYSLFTASICWCRVQQIYA
jgi:hypothetical protein